MNDIISQLWYGHLEPIADFGKNNDELKDLYSLLARNADVIQNRIGDDLKGLFEKYNECVNECSRLSEREAFCDGFSLAVKIITQAIGK